MARPFKSVKKCSRCGDRLYHAFRVKDADGCLFCAAQCYRKHLRDVGAARRPSSPSDAGG
jgi:hypothetical protein